MHISNNLSKKIISWYDNNKRSLPWRVKFSSPKKLYYRLLSEFMLQQTQVKTVVPYFKRFIKEIKTLKILSTTSERKVLKLWEGLGYYRRAKNLIRTAKIIDNWKKILGKELFEACTPKSFKNIKGSEIKLLNIMVKKGKEVEVEYSRRIIINKINSFLGYEFINTIKLINNSDKK